MALKSGISYRDWAYLSTMSTDISFSSTGLSLPLGALPITNMLSPRLREIGSSTPTLITGFYRLTLNITTSNTTTANEFDGSIGMTVGCISIMNHNFKEAGVTKIITKVYDLTNTLLYTISDSSPTIAFKDANYHRLMDQTYNSVSKVTVEIICGAAFLDAITIGRFWVGNYIEESFDGGWGFAHVAGGKENLSVGNDSYLHQKRNRKQMKFDFGAISESNAFGSHPTWFDMSATVSTDSDIIVLPRVETDSELQYLGIYGKLKRPIEIKHRAGPYFSTSLDVVALI